MEYDTFLLLGREREGGRESFMVRERERERRGKESLIMGMERV